MSASAVLLATGFFLSRAVERHFVESDRHELPFLTEAYALTIDGIEKRLRSYGMRTYTQGEIRTTIAQAEIDAYFRNDPDAALAAAKKLGATLTLSGMISSQRGINPVIGINEVAVNMGFVLLAGKRSLADQLCDINGDPGNRRDDGRKAGAVGRVVCPGGKI